MVRWAGPVTAAARGTALSLRKSRFPQTTLLSPTDQFSFWCHRPIRTEAPAVPPARSAPRSAAPHGAAPASLAPPLTAAARPRQRPRRPPGSSARQRLHPPPASPPAAGPQPAPPGGPAALVSFPRRALAAPSPAEDTREVAPLPTLTGGRWRTAGGTEAGAGRAGAAGTDAAFPRPLSGGVGREGAEEGTCAHGVPRIVRSLHGYGAGARLWCSPEPPSLPPRHRPWLGGAELSREGCFCARLRGEQRVTAERAVAQAAVARGGRAPRLPAALPAREAGRDAELGDRSPCKRVGLA